MSKPVLACGRWRLAALVAAVALAVPGAASLAGGLSESSLAPAWTSASQDEKDAWIAAYKFEKADADRAGIAACLDKMAAWEALSTNKLTGVTSLCETTVEKGGM